MVNRRCKACSTMRVFAEGGSKHMLRVHRTANEVRRGRQFENTQWTVGSTTEHNKQPRFPCEHWGHPASDWNFSREALTPGGSQKEEGPFKSTRTFSCESSQAVSMWRMLQVERLLSHSTQGCFGHFLTLFAESFAPIDHSTCALSR
jgi:hypothetical protein